MDKEQTLCMFNGSKIRNAWDEKKQKWYFSIADIITVLTGSSDVKQYITKMRFRDEELRINWCKICTPVYMIARDGKRRKIMATDTEGILRIIQSLPSKKAEPFKLWIAQAGRQKIEEISNPSLAIERAVRLYQAKGKSEKWISKQLKSVKIKKEDSDEWIQDIDLENRDFVILANEIIKVWDRKSIEKYKVKPLKKESQRGNTADIDIILNMAGKPKEKDSSPMVKPIRAGDRVKISQKRVPSSKTTPKKRGQETRSTIRTRKSANKTEEPKAGTRRRTTKQSKPSP